MAFDAGITEKSRDLILLEKARDYMARHGWRQFDTGVEGGPVCIIGALCAADNWDNKPGATLDRTQRAGLLGFKVRPGNASAVVQWNDAPGRTQAEVLARFDEAIVRLSGERA